MQPSRSRWRARVLAGIAAAVVASMAPAVARGQVVGGIRGSVVDEEAQGPVSSAQVTVLETGAVARSDPNGRFVFDSVVPGVYTLAVTRDGYERQTQSNVAVMGGEFAQVVVRLVSQVYEMDELVVSGGVEEGGEQALLLQRQEATGVLESMGSELFSRAGTDTAAAALKKVVGTTVVDDKYVVVRGLADRYVNTLLNGGRIPSADPDRRAVNVDLFPTKLLDSITTTKTFSPDLPGDFTGGSIDIKTKKFPERFTFAISGKVGYNDGTTLNDDFLSYGGGGVSFLGFDPGGRSLPDETDHDAPGSVGFPGFTANADEARRWDAATRALSPAMAAEPVTAPVDYAFSAVIGETVKFLDRPLGIFVGVTYDREYNSDFDCERNRYQFAGADTPLIPENGDPVNLTHDQKSTEELTWGSVLTLAFQPSENHELQFTMFFTKSAEDYARYRNSDHASNVSGAFREEDFLRYVERTLLAFQLKGNHEFWNGVRVDWLLGSALAEQDEPDVRTFTAEYSFDGVNRSYGQPFNELPFSAARYWRFFEERTDSAKVDVTIPLAPDSENDSYLKTGFSFDTTKRQFEQDSFTYFPGVSEVLFTDKFFSSSDGTRFAQVFLDPDHVGIGGDFFGFQYFFRQVVRNQSVGLDAYDADQDISAWYAMANIEVAPFLEVIAGARFEYTDIKIPLPILEAFPGDATIAQLDILPALLANFEIAEKFMLRLGWSQTVARPTFKELAPIYYVDPNEIDPFIGNPALGMSSIDNFDVRLEWFPASGSVLAGSLFYKRIENPIEKVRTVLSGNIPVVQYRNFPEGDVYGIELEARHRLEHLSKVFDGWNIFRNLEIAVNGAYLVSEVKNPQSLVEQQIGFGYRPERVMQNQPSFTFNASVAYDNHDSGTFVGLFYNLTGPFLYLIGTDGLPDIYEIPPANLDLTIQQGIGKHWKLTMRAKNLLAPEAQRLYNQIGGVTAVYEKCQTDREYSIGMEYSW